MAPEKRALSKVFDSFVKKVIRVTLVPTASSSTIAKGSHDVKSFLH